MAKYVVRYDMALNGTPIYEDIVAGSFEEADDAAFRTSGKPGYSSGSYTVYVDSFDKKALLEAAELLEDEMIDVIVLEPGKFPRFRRIMNSLETLQSIVGGYIETLKIGNGVVAILNEEGKLKKLKPNFYYNGDLIVGTVVLLASEGDHFASIGDRWREIENMRFLTEGES